MEKLGHDVTFICPTNELCRCNLSEAIISVTVHSFFVCGIDDEMRVGKFDDSKFDVVVFDDINLND
jgi:hypothetical protein